MPTIRSTIIRGPATVVYGSETFYSKDDIKVELGHDPFPIETSALGTVQERTKQRICKVSFTPAGKFSLTNLWAPFNTKKPGDRILGNSDADLVVWSLAGKKFTFYNVAITKIPDIVLSTNKTIPQSVEFTGLGKGDVTDQSTANSFFLEETAAWSDASLDPDEFPTQVYTAALGVLSSPWDDIQTKDGWVISLDMDMKPVEIDSYGLVDWTVGNPKAVAKAVPIGVTEADILTLTSLHLKRGAAIPTQGDLVITGDGVSVTLHNVQVRMAPLAFGYDIDRIENVEFQARRKVVTGVLSNLFTIADS